MLYFYSIAKPDTNISLSRALGKVISMKTSKLTRLLAIALIAMFTLGMLASFGCDGQESNTTTPPQNNNDDGEKNTGFFPSDITIDIPDDGSLTDSAYGISIREGSPWLIGYSKDGEKIIEQELPEEFLEVGVIRVMMKDIENLKFTCCGYEETLEEWKDLSVKQRSALGCVFYYQSGEKCCLLDAKMAREYSVITADGDGVFVGFDDYYLLYKPAEGEEMQAGFDAMKLQIMINGKFDRAIDNLSNCFEQVDLEPVL